jgi:hypothetical protein
MNHSAMASREPQSRVICRFRITSFSDVLATLRSKRTFRLVLETDLPSFPIGYVVT